MKFTISKNIIEKQIDRCSAGFIPNSNSPFGSFYVLADRNGLTLITTNGELSFKSFISQEKLEVEEVGFCLLDGTFLRDIVKKSEDKITFQVIENEIEISWKNTKIVKVLKDQSIFPEIDFESVGKKVNINIKDFRRAIKNTAFAASPLINNPILSSINLNSQNSSLTLAATDTNRFASETIAIDSDVEFNISINAKNLKEFIVGEISENIDFYISESKINYTFDGLTVQSRILNVPYKDISSIFPTAEQLKYRLTINKKEILDLIDKATIILPEKNNAISFSLSSTEIKVSISKQESGRSKVRTENIIKYYGKDVVLYVNYRFLKEAISVFENTVDILIDERVTRLFIISESNRSIKQLIGLVNQ